MSWCDPNMRTPDCGKAGCDPCDAHRKVPLLTEWKRYIGDAVYVDFDGFNFILTTEDGLRATNTIVLEPDDAAALLSYINGLLGCSHREQPHGPDFCPTCKKPLFINDRAESAMLKQIEESREGRDEMEKYGDL